MILATIIIFILAFGFRNGYQFKEDNSTGEQALKYNSYWHTWQAVIQLDFAALVFISSDYDYTIVLVFISAFWLFFDGIVNYYLNKGFFYLGKTAFIDKTLRKIFKDRYITYSAIIKLLFFISSVLLYIFK